MKLNYDATFGHTWFQTAIDLAILAKQKHEVEKGGVADYKEAYRLYVAAINDAEEALVEIHLPENKDWAVEFSQTIVRMEWMVKQWENKAKFILSYCL